MANHQPVVVVPNWNGEQDLAACLDSVLSQSVKAHIIVVDNGSVDGSVKLIEEKYPDIELIKHAKNLGYAGGVNAGFRRAIELGAKYAAPFNNDAVADKDWLKHLVDFLDENESYGIATCKVISADGKFLDSTGDLYTTWGLPYPRGRGETDLDKYDDETEVFGASGAASLYRVEMLEEIGLFDEDFFAYYEDVDLSFRAQLAGWKVAFVPKSQVFHKIGGTSSRIRGFTAYQTLKNPPMLLLKNVPRKYFWYATRRNLVAQVTFFISAALRGHLWSAVKGKTVCISLFFKNLRKRKQIQSTKKVSDEYIWSMLVHDLPPNAAKLRAFRGFFWKLRGKS